MPSTIGTAYIQIEPSTKGIAGKIEKELNDAGKKGGSSFSQGFGGVIGTIGGATKSVLGGFASVTTSAISSVGKASASLIKDATSSFAEFEQLEGGAKLMFGDAYDFIADKSQNAFSKIQMSQNDYLQQVNGLAVGLKTALGGDEMAAAQLADRVVTAEADVVAATGNSQEAVQNAFNGIMKSNYTMLDNLQLGITPTKEGMQEVIDKVNEWNKANGNASDYVIDNLADVQSALVDYIEMQGLAGYAENEGAETIQGALASTQAAWQNLMTGLVSGGDLSGLIDGLITSASALVENVEPVITQGLEGISNMISQFLPVLVAKIPPLLQQNLPILVTSAVEIIKTLGEGLVQSIPILTPSIIELVTSLVDMLVQLAPDLIQVGLDLLLALSTGLIEALPTLIPAVTDIITTIVDYLIDHIDLLIYASIELVAAIGKGIIQSLPKLLESGKKMLMKIVEGFKITFSYLYNAAAELITSLGNKITSFGSKLVNAGKNLVKSIKEGLVQAWNDIVNWFQNKIEELKEKFTSVFNINLPGWLTGDGTSSSGGTGTTSTQGWTYNPSLSSLNNGLQPITTVSNNTNVTVTLEGDANRLFRVIQSEASRNAMLVGG